MKAIVASSYTLHNILFAEKEKPIQHKIYVISAYYLSAEALEIVGCALHGGVHIVETVLSVEQFGVGVV